MGSMLSRRNHCARDLHKKRPFLKEALGATRAVL